MDQAADTRDVADVVHAFGEFAPHENVTGKKWFNDALDASPRRPLHAQTRIKHLQAKSSDQIGRGDMLVLGLGPRTVPGGALKVTLSQAVIHVNVSSLDVTR